MPEISSFIGATPEVVIAVKTDNPLLNEMGSEEKLLLAKLVKAMNLTFDKLVIIPVAESFSPAFANEIQKNIENFPIKKVLYFGSSLASSAGTGTVGFNMRQNEILVACTYSPSELLDDESLKRPAWEHLKSFSKK
jgi:hypothetical protein